MMPDNVSLIGAMILALGYFINRWMKSIDLSISHLGQVVNDWTVKAIRIETENIGRDKKLAEHDRDIESLWEKQCPLDECPMEIKPKRRRSDREV